MRYSLEPVAMIAFFVLENWWFKQFAGCRVAELGEVVGMFAHMVHDVAQRLDVECVALQDVKIRGTLPNGSLTR